MITTTVHDEIRTFAAAVRANLDDLPADEVDDLLDGLEADLTDQASEAGDGFTLPDATVYAAELRAAAGLPARSEHPSSPVRRPLRVRVSEAWRSGVSRVRATPAGAWTLDVLASLAPVWWVLRAFVLYLFLVPALRLPNPGVPEVLNSALGALRFPGLLLFVAILLVSIQWGRGRWAHNAGLRWMRTIVTAVAIVLTPFFLFGLLSATQQTVAWATSSSPTPYQPGLAVDGTRVRNIFAFDANGDPIPLVQLFDQDGRPLTTVGGDDSALFDPSFYGGGEPVPTAFTAPGRANVWNVFPLREVPAGALEWDDALDLAKAEMPALPFTKVQPLPDSAETDATPPPAPTPSETADSEAPPATDAAPEPSPTGAVTP